MGTAYILANHTKRVYLNPHEMGDGYNLSEIAGSSSGTAEALCYLLASREEWGWAGDSIEFVSESEEYNCIKYGEPAEYIFHICTSDGISAYDEVSAEVREVLTDKMEFKSPGWVRKKT